MMSFVSLLVVSAGLAFQSSAYGASLGRVSHRLAESEARRPTPP